MNRSLRACLTLLLCGMCAAVPAQETVTLESLLAEMSDMGRLAAAPSPAYVTKQFSSYDQRSTDPAVQDDTNWFANGDRGQVLREEETSFGKEYVLMDAEGPGAIVRIWSANPDKGGIIRVYLDSAAEPAVEMPLQAMLGGGAKPFVKPIAGEWARGWTSWLPIPYAKHCKVTISVNDIYHHINYRTYAPGTTVRTFSVPETEALMPLIRATAATLAMPENVTFPDDAETEEFFLDLPAGATVNESLPAAGPAAVCEISLRVDTADLEAALRGCLLEIAFDGNPASVIAPLGDFFGTAPGANPYRSVTSGVLDDKTLYSRWVMPYRDKAVFTLTNHTAADISLEGSVTVRPRPWTEDSLYFHAKWRAAADLPTRPMIDWNYLAVDGGPGRFAGVMLHIANPVVDWWGEGDEKIYVDGEAFPSHFGTGTEDYFSYAWCSPEVFTQAYHNQPRCDGPGNYGHTCVSRYHVMDDIPWTTSFRFDLEMWHWADTKVTQAVTPYWYAPATSADNTPPVDPALLVVPALPGIPGVEGAVEGETLEIVSVTGGVTERQDGDWSRGQQLWWRDGKPGDTLTLAFDVEKAGTYKIQARVTKAPDFGIVQHHLNGKPLGHPMDLFNAGAVARPKPLLLGREALKAGRNELKVEITGANEKAEKRHMFGLDYLLLEAE